MIAANATTGYEDDEDEPRPVGPDPLVGMTLADRYRILGQLGAGGMGIVYKVEHTRIGKLMAMKLLAGELSRDEAVVKRFKREAELASRLSHPNTVQVFDFGHTDNGLTYLVMELVVGDDLGRVVRREGAMSPLRMARIVAQVCSSLGEAHRLGIVHRDLKPENVLLVKGADGHQEVAKVCDFGLAKLRQGAETQSDVTGHGAVVGTPYYMSPEQIRGEDVDLRTDVYALGGVIYKLVTGQPPFHAPSPMAVFAKHLTEQPVPPSHRAPGVPPSVDAIVMRALAKRRDDRFPDVDSMREELVRVLRDGNVSSSEILVDSGEVRRAATDEGALDHTQIALRAATRDEVEAYERRLRRQRVFAQVAVALAVAGVAAGAARAWIAYTAPKPYDGLEVEPNDDAATAQSIPPGRGVKGMLGKRLNATTSDRDFYAFEVPAGASQVTLKTQALPNFATCTLLYRAGLSDSIARFCTGAPGRDLEVTQLKVDPGRYLVAVLQDVDPYAGDSPPPVMENVSDTYALSFSPSERIVGREVEPNDQPPTAGRLRVASKVRGALAFVRDVDVFCADDRDEGKPVRWVVRDAVDRARDAGVVLEATVERGGMKDPDRTLIHRDGVQSKELAGHAIGAWTSAAFTPTPGSQLGCLRLRLALDPWSTVAPTHPPAGSEEYSVTLEAAP